MTTLIIVETQFIEHATLCSSLAHIWLVNRALEMCNLEYYRERDIHANSYTYAVGYNC